jgi:hypothetical protein
MPENATKEYDGLFSTPSTFNPNDRSKNDTGNAGGSRRDLGDVGNTTGAVSNLAGGSNNNSGESGRNKDNEGFGLDNGKDVKGSLKVHIKLDLEADIRITAKIKGDIAIGLL